MALYYTYNMCVCVVRAFFGTIHLTAEPAHQVHLHKFEYIHILYRTVHTHTQTHSVKDSVQLRHHNAPSWALDTPLGVCVCV